MKPTMKAIAEKLDLSINAVSLALNNRAGVSEATRSLVLRTAEEMGYFEIKSKYVKTYASKHIGVLIGKKNYKTQFYTKVLYGIERQANDMGYYAIVLFLDVADLWSSLENQKFCGLLVVGVVEEEILKKLSEYHIPLVLVDNMSYSIQFDCILTDNRIGTYESTSYLIGQGYKKIGFVGDYGYSHSIRERYWGYLEALMAKYKDLGAVNDIAGRYSILGKMDDYILENNAEALVEMIKKKNEIADAYQCGNDKTAMVLYAALKELGYRIPDDVAVVGFDDSDYATIMFPELTTSHVKMTRMGQESVRRLLWRINHKNADVSKVMMTVDFILRDSVKKGD